MNNPKIYSGHRERMRHRLSLAGFEAMATYELLEMLLYFPVARRDTHPAAKLLLLEFGSLSGVLGARCEELRRVEGIGRRCAEFINCAGELIFSEPLEDKAARICDTESLAAHFAAHFKGECEPVVALLCLDNSMRPIKTVTVAHARLSSGGIRPGDFVSAAIYAGAARVAIAEYSPFSAGIAAEGEISGYNMLSDAFRSFEIPSAAGLIISGNGYSRIDAKSFSSPVLLKQDLPEERLTGAGLAALLEPLLSFVCKEPRAAAERIGAAIHTKEILFTTDTDTLAELSGSRSAAELIRLLAFIASRSAVEAVRFGKKYTEEQIKAYLSALFLSYEREALYLLSFDTAGRLIAADKLSEGSYSGLNISVRAIADAAMRRCADSLILAHNHPRGEASPSEDDISATRTLKDALAPAGIRLAAHYTVSPSEIYKID